MSEAAHESRRRLRLLPLVLVLLAVAAFYALGLQRYLTLDALREHRTWLVAWVARRPVIAPLSFVAIYAALVACSVPAAAGLSLSRSVWLGFGVEGRSSFAGPSLGDLPGGIFCSSSDATASDRDGTFIIPSRELE